MSEIALYRKHRPKTFAHVLGQDEIISILERSVSDKNFSHAYLFSGGRGTGKTTVARIFAAAIGCKPADMTEIDGASNRNIDDIRELRAGLATLPFESPYKVYIIDEVHMLTKEAWNAFLKTLEEPPAHVVFILATTDREKVPDTVVSRCQSFVFRQPNFDELKKFAADVAKKEKVKLDGPSAEIVAMFGDGSYRDALSVLEKVLVRAKDGELNADIVARVVGAPTSDLINRVLRSIDSQGAEDGLLAIRQADKDHVEMKAFLKLLLHKLRAVLLLRYAPAYAKEFVDEFTPDDLELLSELAFSKEKKINSHTLYEFLEASRDMGFSVARSLPIELALIKVTGEAKA